MPQNDRIETVEFAIDGAPPQVAFSLDENSTPEDFIGAIVVLGFVSTGKVKQATEADLERAAELGPALLMEADLRFGPGTAQKMVISIAAGVQITNALSAKYGSAGAVKARLDEVGVDTLVNEVMAEEDKGGPFADVPGILNYDDEVL